MQQIIKNRYLKATSFNSHNELNEYVKNLKVKNGLDLKDSFGDYYYCYSFINSLTSENEFWITFSTDEKEENLSILLWDAMDLFILNSGVKIYFIAQDLTIINSFDITSPLVGLQVLNNDKILILEEATLRVISSNGKIEQEELFDLILNFHLEGNKLSITTEEYEKKYTL
jgi:hypothetical protein